uniref:Uncharacterized protein n=1 Tax=Cannabis sativa TaxID=3483 RepID=A0A803R7Z1_CANSA
MLDIVTPHIVIPDIEIPDLDIPDIEIPHIEILLLVLQLRMFVPFLCKFVFFHFECTYETLDRI